MLLVASWLVEIDDETSTVNSALNCGIHLLEFLKGLRGIIEAFWEVSQSRLILPTYQTTKLRRLTSHNKEYLMLKWISVKYLWVL